MDGENFTLFTNFLVPHSLSFNTDPINSNIKIKIGSEIIRNDRTALKWTITYFTFRQGNSRLMLNRVSLEKERLPEYVMWNTKKKIVIRSNVTMTLVSNFIAIGIMVCSSRTYSSIYTKTNVVICHQVNA